MKKDKDSKPYVHDDPDAIRQAKVNASVLEKMRRDDISALMAMPEFRRYVWWLLEQSHVFRTSFTGNSETFFREGERNIGLKVFLEINQECPEHYATMVKENTHKENG